MNEEHATDLANAWNQLDSKPNGITRHYSSLRQLLRDSLPDDFVAAGVAELDEVPVALVVTHGALLIVKVIDRERPEGARQDPSPEIQVRARPLAPGVMVDTALYTEDEPLFRQSRRWSFRWSTGEMVEFVARVESQDFGLSGPDSAEVVGRAAAAQLGWKFPAPVEDPENEL